MKPPITFRKSKTDGWQIIDRARHCVAVANSGETAKAICDAVNKATAYPQTLDKTETAGEKEANANSRATEQRRDPQMPRKRGRPKRVQA